MRHLRPSGVLLGDVALVALCLVVGWAGTGAAATTPGPALLAFAVMTPGILALPFRRRHPVGAWALWIAPNLLYWLAIGAPENGGLLLSGTVLLYAVGRWAPDRRRALAVLVATVPGLVVHELRDPTNTDLVTVLRALPYDAVAPVAWLLGAFVRVRAEQRTTLTQRVAAQERQRIASELHDVVAHGVSVMVLQAEGAAEVVAQDPLRAQQAMEQVAQTGRAALVELRRALGVLRDPHDPGLREPVPGLAELDLLLDRVRAGGLAVELVREGTPEPLSAGADLALYRTVQEALTNTMRHSRATAARVCVRHRPGAVEVEVLDHGERRPGSRGSGHGLVGLRERVRPLGGRIEAGPLRDKGFRVAVTVPTISADASARPEGAAS
ncbi:MAG TPA: histidine kinase [Angustibacter sp.]|nr:histidine kinase [Angustibacter sp.]